MSQLMDTYVLELALLLKTKVLKLPGKNFSCEKPRNTNKMCRVLLSLLLYSYCHKNMIKSAFIMLTTH